VSQRHQGRRDPTRYTLHKSSNEGNGYVGMLRLALQYARVEGLQLVDDASDSEDVLLAIEPTGAGAIQVGGNLFFGNPVNARPTSAIVPYGGGVASTIIAYDNVIAGLSGGGFAVNAFADNPYDGGMMARLYGNTIYGCRTAVETGHARVVALDNALHATERCVNTDAEPLDPTSDCELRDSYVHSTIDPNPGGGGYGIGFNFHAADNLVENSISWNFNKVMVMRASGGGNVVGYSYFEDGWGSGYPCIVESGMNASHYTTSHMELFEGNRSFSFTAESTWGNSIYVTVFRNHLTARRGAVAPLDAYHYDYVDGAGKPASLFYEDLMGRRAVGISAHHYWQTLVGNVLGTAGQTLITNPRTQGMDRQRRFVYDDDAQNDTENVPMWSVGWGDGPQDSRTVSTLLRHGNYDYVTRGVVWSAGASQDLPPSLYLSGKPAFMGSNPWPWVDPLSGQTYVLPAKARFDRIHGVH
jgi:hypothetical protein